MWTPPSRGGLLRPPALRVEFHFSGLQRNVVVISVYALVKSPHSVILRIGVTKSLSDIRFFAIAQNDKGVSPRLSSNLHVKKQRSGFCVCHFDEWNDEESKISQIRSKWQINASYFPLRPLHSGLFPLLSSFTSGVCFFNLASWSLSVCYLKTSSKIPLQSHLPMG